MGGNLDRKMQRWSYKLRKNYTLCNLKKCLFEVNRELNGKKIGKKRKKHKDR